MVLPASLAYTFTTQAKNDSDDETIKKVVSSCEAVIQRAISNGFYSTLFDGGDIGKPLGDVNDDSALTPLQVRFRDEMTSAGYVVSSEKGWWKLSWGSIDIETSVVTYLVYTSVTPGAIYQQTINAINSALQTLVPPVRANIVLTPDFNESDVGKVDQNIALYVVTAHQQDKATNNTTTIMNALTSSGLGYTTANTKVIKV